MKTLICSILLGYTSWTFAQPATDIILFDLSTDANGNYLLTNPVNISENQGYDNQPAFWPDGNSILYARTVSGQTEIARYIIPKNETVVITNTKQGSEFSPTPTPNGKISSIRLDTTGLQLLYEYDLNGKSNVLVDKMVIGYHAWLNSTDIVAFVLGEPSTLQIIDTSTDKALTVGENIGRSLHKVPNSNRFSYVDKSTEKWMIKSMDPVSGDTRTLVTTLDGAEDYCWTPKGELVMGKDNVLYIKTEDKDEWTVLSDLSNFGITGISRLAMSPNGTQIALVVNE